MRFLLRSAVLFLALASVSFAEVEGDWAYSVSNNEATVTSYSGAGGSVTIPSTLGGYPVRAVGKSDGSSIFGYGITSVITLTIPNSVTSIGEYAFYGCSGLASLTIPNSVTNIGDWAIAGCTALKSMTIPNSVTSLARGLFGSCYGLISVTIPNSVTSIGEYSFGSCTSLTSVTIPNSVTSIGDSVCYGCTALTFVTIPNSVTSIGGYAFYGCSGLASLTIPSSVTSIGPQAFMATRIESVIIPDSTLTIGSDCFFGAPLTNATIPGRFLAQLGALGLPAELSRTLFLAELTKQGIATKADLSGAVSTATAQGIATVQGAPNTYGLYSSTQYDANRITGVAQGKADVTSNPTAYNLFTESSIMDMNLGSLMLKKGANADALNLELTIETKDNLATNGWQVAERISRSVSMGGVQRQFLRVRADAPYVAPNVKVLAHQTLGNILTDGAGRVLYFFGADSPGGNPMFSGSSWPYVSAPAAPKADAGVTATLGSSSFGRTNGPFLTINTRPAYTYAGDTTAGQANGHGAGWVWYTMKADGTVNQ